jgi:hypothetical protein
MDVTAVASLAASVQQAQSNQQLTMKLVKMAAQQNAAILQVLAAAQPQVQAAPAPGNGTQVDITV